MALTQFSPGMLQPRYRRTLTFGAILDETFQIYRRVWLKSVGMWTLSTVVGLLLVMTVGALLWVGGAQAFMGALGDPQRALSGRDPEALVALVGAVIVFSLLVALAFALCYSIAMTGIITLTYRDIHGQGSGFWRTYLGALSRVPVMMGSVIAFFFGLAVLSIPVAILFIPALILGSLISTVALIVWAASPRSRRPWLKWLIVLSTPVGLVSYFSVKWSLWIHAIVIERAGPLQALQRSGELVTGNWFRVFGIWMVMATITYVLQLIPGALMALAVTIIGGANALQGVGDWAGIANYAGSVFGWFLFEALIFIAFTLVFVDLRNRLEGTDLEERLESEQPSAA